jgi:hypothetical protein
MKTPIKEDKCKKEFDTWDTCYKNAYLSEFNCKKEPILEETVDKCEFIDNKINN